jgi:hypothetical protein
MIKKTILLFFILFSLLRAQPSCSIQSDGCYSAQNIVVLSCYTNTEPNSTAYCTEPPDKKGYYSLQKDKSIIFYECSTGCATCLNVDSTSCNTCISGYYLGNN